MSSYKYFVYLNRIVLLSLLFGNCGFSMLSKGMLSKIANSNEICCKNCNKLLAKCSTDYYCYKNCKMKHSIKADKTHKLVFDPKNKELDVVINQCNCLKVVLNEKISDNPEMCLYTIYAPYEFDTSCTDKKFDKVKCEHYKDDFKYAELQFIESLQVAYEQRHFKDKNVKYLKNSIKLFKNMGKGLHSDLNFFGYSPLTLAIRMSPVYILKEILEIFKNTNINKKYMGVSCLLFSIILRRRIENFFIMKLGYGKFFAILSPESRDARKYDIGRYKKQKQVQVGMWLEEYRFCSYSDLEAKIRLLIDYGANVNDYFPDADLGNVPLLSLLIIYGDKELIKMFIENDKIDVNMRGSLQLVPLHFVMLHERFEESYKLKLIKKLLKKGALNIMVKVFENLAPLDMIDFVKLSEIRSKIRLIKVLKRNFFDVDYFTYECALCKKKNMSLKYCKGCLDACYCSRHCQKLDWDNHKPKCRRSMITKVKF